MVTDCRENLELTLGKFTKQIRKLEGSFIKVGNLSLRIHQYGVFDLCALTAFWANKTTVQHSLMPGQTADLTTLETTKVTLIHQSSVTKSVS